VVGIADDDADTILWEPRTPLLMEALALMKRLIEHHGGNPYGARHCRRLLLEAGFTRAVAGASTWCGGVWGTPEETRDFAAWFADQLTAPAAVELATAQGWADQAALHAMVAESCRGASGRMRTGPDAY
jgi:hypothetical protein